MAIIDVFNGDADGICALVQLRHAQPLSSTLVTGVKRDIQLLDNVVVNVGDKLTVLDISLDKNRIPLEQIIKQGAEVFYVDHHYAGDIPTAKNFTAIINTAADVCTSILVNNYLQSQFLAWAVVGAFGDNLSVSARAIARPLNLSEQQLTDLENLGIYMNYNGYGSQIEDLHFPPSELYLLASAYITPFDFLNDAHESFQKLQFGYQSDMSKAIGLSAEFESDAVAVYLLPDEPWARRVSGVYGNELANKRVSRAHAVVTQKINGNYLVSVRAPLNNKQGADALCRRFITGGGRAAAAGINDLPANNLASFIDQFNGYYSA